MAYPLRTIQWKNLHIAIVLRRNFRNVVLFCKQTELKTQIRTQALDVGAPHVSNCGKFTAPVVRILVSRLRSEAPPPVSPSAREPLSCCLEVTHSRLSPACCADWRARQTLCLMVHNFMLSSPSHQVFSLLKVYYFLPPSSLSAHLMSSSACCIYS